MNILLLASQSPSRKHLLQTMELPFVMIEQYADESACDWTLPLPQLVSAIAQHKMKHVMMPQGFEGQEAYVLTADTLTQDKQGNKLPKPLARQKAIQMLKEARKGVRVATGFCLDKKVYQFDTWQIKERILQEVQAECVFNVPDHWIDRYLENSIALQTSGAIMIEEYGTQFLQSIDGSLSTIQGLPMAELRQALEKMGFFN